MQYTFLCLRKMQCTLTNDTDEKPKGAMNETRYLRGSPDSFLHRQASGTPTCPTLREDNEPIVNPIKWAGNESRFHGSAVWAMESESHEGPPCWCVEGFFFFERVWRDFLRPRTRAGSFGSDLTHDQLLMFWSLLWTACRYWSTVVLTSHDLDLLVEEIWVNWICA